MPTGTYDFGKSNGDATVATHKENELDAYYFVADAAKGKSTAPIAQDLLQGYYKVTGNPVLLPEYAFYVGHLNAWNRDMWSADAQNGYGKKQIKGSAPATDANAGEIQYEKGGTGTAMAPNTHVESLNGTARRSTRRTSLAVLTSPRSSPPAIALIATLRTICPWAISCPMTATAPLCQDGFGKSRRRQ